MRIIFKYGYIMGAFNCQRYADIFEYNYQLE